jgi:hypothetical protein
MAEFNENPFKKDTPVRSFSNSSEFEFWQENNCNECVNYENESESEENAKCKFAYHLDFGTILGTIPLWVAKGIGCNYNPLYQTCKLNSRCTEMRKGDEPF